MADSSDKLKRNRGRRGLDMLKRMQNSSKVELQIHDTNLPELREVSKVDERLVVLATFPGEFHLWLRMIPTPDETRDGQVGSPYHSCAT